MNATRAAVLVLLVAVPGVAAGGQDRCGSSFGGRSSCRIGPSGKIRLVMDLSQNRCDEGVTWGTESSGVVWVSNGCIGLFATVDPTPAPAARPQVVTVECASKGAGRTSCAADTKLGVALVRVTGTGRCTLEETWGFGEEGVWVSGGCSGQFALGGFRIDEAAVPKTALRATCASTDGALQRCPFESVRGVGLIRQTGTVDCVLNRTWGYDKEGIWVRDGCRAEFAVVR